MDKFIIYLFILVVAVCAGEGYRILVVFPFPSKSHGILGSAVVRSLLDAGHQVTYLTPFPLQISEPRLQQVDVSFTIDLLWSQNVLDLKEILHKNATLDNPAQLMEVITKLNHKIIANEEVLSFLTDPQQQFDVVLVEWLFSDFFNGLSAVFNCPYIWVSSMEPHWAALRLVDEATNPAYVPSAVSSTLPPFTFVQRVQQLWNQLTVYIITEVYSYTSHKVMYEKLFGPIVAKRGQQLPPYHELKYNASLMLGNAHVSFGQATPLPQSYIPIGGYHIDPHVKPLPQDLQNLMDNAKSGVIYFSMGSNVKSQDFPDELKRDLLKVFGDLKQTVIWKFEDVLPNLPKNVHILKWAPQPSILSHPNCVLFITHGGLLSTTEAVHFGVPVVGVPAFADQFNNVDRAVSRGFARRVDLSYTMAADLQAAIEDILNDKKYLLKIRELSSIYHDRLVPPRRELVHWVEHVVRTRGARHLRSPAVMMPWYQKMYLDLLLLILTVITSVTVAVKQLFCSRNFLLDKKKKLN